MQVQMPFCPSNLSWFSLKPEMYSIVDRRKKLLVYKFAAMNGWSRLKVINHLSMAKAFRFGHKLVQFEVMKKPNDSRALSLW